MAETTPDYFLHEHTCERLPDEGTLSAYDILSRSQLYALPRREVMNSEKGYYISIYPPHG